MLAYVRVGQLILASVMRMVHHDVKGLASHE